MPQSSWGIPLARWGKTHYGPYDMSTHAQLLSEIEGFLADHRIAPTTFGLRSVNDAKLVANLRAGADVTTRTLDKVRSFMREHSSERAA